jgi:serine/threonine protein kinase
MKKPSLFEVAPSVTQPASLIDGTEFEIFEKDILGHGSHGVLYRGRERSSARSVAVRVLSTAAPAAPSLLTQLRNHADRLAPLDGNGIVPILGSGDWQGKPFYAMELVEGQSLASCMIQAHRFTTDEIIHVAEGIAQALRAAWKSGLAPCGIKPSNVFLSATGAVRVTDLGLASGLSEAIQIPLARWQGRYVSPEQISGDPADIRSDLYALGVMLYELATRKLPFEGYDSATSFYYQLLHVDPPAPRELGASIPRELERVVLRCLSKAPSDRYQDPDDLLQDLAAVRRRQNVPAKSAGLPEDDAGDFDIDEDQVIGEGGMGILYRARQHSLGRPVAVKVIRDVFTASPEFVQRFRQEAELLAQVNHPNVVQVFGTGTWHGRLFYAMELVEGQDVATKLREKQNYTPDEVLHVAEGVARALAAAWKFRIVHRDIKPSNILLTPQGDIKVADFGLAKSLRIPKTDSRLIAGTSEYISPEQGMGKAVDIRSDIYSLGVVLYELLMGRPPFKSDGSFTFVVYQHVHSAPPALEPLTGTIPAPVKEIIRRCLEKKPEQRFQTPEELLSAIVKARGSVRPAAKPTFGALPAPAAAALAGPLGRDWRGRTALLVLVMLIGVACALFAVLHRPHSVAPSPASKAEFDLRLGLGEFAEAMQEAEAKWGRGSKEYQTAAARQSEILRADAEIGAREALHARDWRAASEALEKALHGSAPDRAREIGAALKLARELRRAEELEQAGKVVEAFEIYRGWVPRAPSLHVYLRERMSRLQDAVDQARKPR